LLGIERSLPSSFFIFIFEEKIPIEVLLASQVQIVQKKMPLFMKVHVHWMNLIKNQIKQKFQSFKF